MTALLSQKRVVCYEMNEVPRRVLEDFTGLNPNSTLARLLKQGVYYETIAEDRGILSPWVTWPTLHRGVSNEKHCISDFGQDLEQVNGEYPSTSTILVRNGVHVGVFGSLHTYPPPADMEKYAFYVPDTFANGPECFPEALSAFQEFNLRMVDVSGRNVAKTLMFKHAARFIGKAPGLGLQIGTLGRLANQVLSERLNPPRVGRRRTSQVQIAFDIFLQHLKASKPQFASFFTNHVASSMHRYWPGKFPEDYTGATLGKEWHKTYGNEIDFTMAEADRQVSCLAYFVEKNPGYVLMIVSSMGQAAVDTSKIIHSQLYIENTAKFMAALGVQDGQWSKHRAMLPRYVFKLTDATANGFRESLRKLTINGAHLDVVELGLNVFRIKLGHENLSDKETIVKFGGRQCDVREFGLVNIAIQDEAGSYAYHIPNGILIAYDPAQRKSYGEDRGAISTLNIAPTLLANFGIARPSYMRSEIN
jgi:hypothetical protein